MIVFTDVEASSLGKRDFPAEFWLSLLMSAVPVGRILSPPPEVPLRFWGP